jgi:sialidase-1
MRVAAAILPCMVVGFVAGFFAMGGAARALAMLPPVTSGLIAYWPGENTAVDASGNGHNGALVNGGYTTGVVGSAFNLQGTGNYVEVPDSAAWAFGTDDFTISLFTNVHSVTPGYFVDIGHPSNVFIGQDEGGGVQNKWFVGLGEDITFHVNGPGAGASVFLADAAYPTTLDEWHHIAVRRSGTLFEIFIDGLLAGSETSSISIPDVAHPLRLGESEGFELDGFLDEVAIYNRALTDGEIQQLSFNFGSQGQHYNAYDVRPEAVIGGGGQENG